MRAALARGLKLIARAVEGEYRSGPYFLPVTGGWLPDGAAANWFQLGQDPIPASSGSAIVEACVSAYSQTVAMCPGDHWRLNKKNGRDRITNSALYRILRYPNEYQSISDFMLNMTRCLYLDGNAYALALRNDRYEISELHIMDPRQSKPQLAVTGDVFYRLGGNQIIEQRITGPLIVPQRDVLHIRLHTTSRAAWPWPLIGESPLLAALGDIATLGAMNEQQFKFYQNMARPSAVLGTELPLDKDTVDLLRARWNEQVRGLNSGGTPILTHGLKILPFSMPTKDAEIADVMKMTEQHIALAFRIPLQILGISTQPGSATAGSTEALIQTWLASGLGFALNHIEEAIGNLFALKGQPEEYVEFSTSVLLRSAFKDRIEGLARGVQGGILAPNEARNLEDYGDVEYGDEPRVQQQLVPLSAASQITAPGSTGPHPPPSPGPQAPPSGTPAAAPKQPTATAEKGYLDERKRQGKNINSIASRILERRIS